jgi:hypothetical protein
MAPGMPDLGPKFLYDVTGRIGADHHSAGRSATGNCAKPSRLPRSRDHAAPDVPGNTARRDRVFAGVRFASDNGTHERSFEPWTEPMLSGAMVPEIFMTNSSDSVRNGIFYGMFSEI